LGPVLAGVREMEGMIEGAVRGLVNEGGKKIVVILDGVDFMMAALGEGTGGIMEMVGGIREVGFLFDFSYFGYLSFAFCGGWLVYSFLLFSFFPKIFRNVIPRMRWHQKSTGNRGES
jgi:hypothetical protein